MTFAYILNDFSGIFFEVLVNLVFNLFKQRNLLPNNEEENLP